ncbi:hypothetical protein AB0M31_26145 [Streptomyces sp. NPDC051773]|uniref:hypothetical protein n=1 Tax=Streptomyces sp. NPDC051773 TaxID=3156682 RepID=UPI003429308E
MPLIRRTRPLALVAATAALLAGLTGRPATAAEEPTTTRLALAGDLFRMTDTSTATAATTLAGRLADADLDDVVTTEYTTDSAGTPDPGMNLGSMRACAGDETKALPPVDRRIAWCWSSALGDDTTPRWWPQGMSTTGTADGADGAIQGRSVTAVAWHYKTFRTDPEGTVEANDRCRTNNLLRLSFIDRDTLKYRHVLLVEPTSGGQNFKYVTGHGGGLVWYANHLYVTDTTGGIRVFDVNKLSKVDTYGSGLNTYGVDGVTGRSSACGLPYVLPQTHYYRQASPPPSGGCDNDAVDGTPDPDSLCYSWLSLDKTGGAPYKLVAGEWYGGAAGARIVRYQLNPTSAAAYPGLLNMSGGRTVIQDAYAATRYVGLQGGMTWTDDSGLLNFAFHKGCALQPAVFSRTWAGDTRAPTACNVTVGGRPHASGNWAVGTPQALSHWPRLGTARVDELWGLTEHICAGTALRASFPDEFKAVEEADERRNACDGYQGEANLSLRTVFAVGFDDPAVMDLH